MLAMVLGFSSTAEIIEHMVYATSPEPALPAVPARPARLILIRHAHTASNDEVATSVLSGWADLPLTERGYEQIDRLRDRFRQGPSFAAIYSSPLRRAWDTARALTSAGRSRPRLHLGLREIGCGSLDGMLIAKIRESFPDIWTANLRQNDDDFRWPGGESYREFRARCLAAIEMVASAHPGSTVAIVTHSGVITQVVGAIEGTSAARWDRHRAGNTSLTEILWWRGSGTVVGFDDRAHLAA